MIMVQTKRYTSKQDERKMTLFLGILLAIVIVALLVTQVIMPLAQKASEDSAAQTLSQAGAERLATITADVQVGDTVKLGEYEQDNDTSDGAEDIEWRVLAVEDGKALLISDKALEVCRYDDSKIDGNNWEACDLHEWLNGDFVSDGFSPDEQAAMSGEMTLLTQDEALEYFASDEDRICCATEYAASRGAIVDESGACSWWLRTPAVSAEFTDDDDESRTHEMYVYSDGAVQVHGLEINVVETCARPAVWVTL